MLKIFGTYSMILSLVFKSVSIQLLKAVIQLILCSNGLSLHNSSNKFYAKEDRAILLIEIESPRHMLFSIRDIFVRVSIDRLWDLSIDRM